MTDIEFPKLVTKWVNGISYVTIDDSDKIKTTKSASKEQKNEKPYYVVLSEHFGGQY